MAEVKVLFPVGQVVATPGALALMERAGIAPMELLRRHVSGDWGVLPPEDVKENEYSITRNLRILSSYPVLDDRIWIITEADRSSTTFLLPDEY